MLHLKNMKSPMKILFGILLVTIFPFGIVLAIDKSDTVISHDEQWRTPFESISTTVYDLGDGYTSTVTTTTVTTITSVAHSDQGMFSAEQWDEILGGIENGSIVWAD